MYSAYQFIGGITTLNLGNGPGLLVALANVEQDDKDAECDWFWSSWWINLLFSLGLHLVILALLIAIPITTLYGSSFANVERTAFEMSVLALFLSLLGSVFYGMEAYCTARLADVKGRVAGLATFVLQSLLLIVLLSTNPSVFVLPVALLGASLLVRPVQAVFFFRDYPWLLRGFRWLKIKEAKQLLSHNSAATVHMLSEMAWMTVSLRILGDTSTETVALAGVLLGIARVGGTIPEMILAPIVPAVRKIILSGQSEWPKLVVRKCLSILFVISAVVAFFGFFVGQPVLSWLFKEYVQSAVALSTIALGVGLMFEAAARNLVTITADLWWFGYVSLGKAALQVVLMLAWLGPYGLAGVLNALALGAFAFFLVTLIRFRFEARRIAASALAAAPG